MTWTELPALLTFVAICATAGAAGGYFRPGRWYAALAKPSWDPPNWVFPIAWAVLYLAIAVAGWLVWREAGLDGTTLAFAFYAAQLLLNVVWSALFFGLHRMDFALAELLVLWVAIVGTIIAFAAISLPAALLLVPYLLWVSFAGVLNLAMLRYNPAEPRFLGGG